MKIKMKGFESVQKRFNALEAGMRREYVQDVLTAGAQVYVESWRNTIGVRGHVRTGALQGSVKITDIRERGGGSWIATIAPDGYDTRGVANDLKANVINKRIDKRLKTAAEAAAKKRAEAAMQAKLDELVRR